MLDPKPARSNMVEQQIRPWHVLDEKVLQLMETINREDFVPSSYQAVAFADTSIPLGHDQFMLPPALIGRILAALAIQPSNNVLEIGTGSGYLTALIAKLARFVTSVELYQPLAAQAHKHLTDLKLRNLEILQGNAIEILRGGKAFDVVVLTGSVQQLPKNIINQTKIGGQLFAVIGSKPVMQACIFTRMNEGTWSKNCLFETVTPPLEGITNAATFEF